MTSTVALGGPTEVRRRPEDVTVDWLREVLVASGRLDGGHRVVDVAFEPIGTGQMADTIRLRLGYDVDGAGPATVVAKFASADEQSHATGRQMRAYEVEVQFYASIASRIATRVPGLVSCALDPDDAWFTLVLDDVVGGVQGDQIAGCDADVAAASIAELAGLHAPCFQDSSLEALGWLNRSTPESDAFTSSVVQSLFPGFVERYGDRLDPELIDLLEEFVGVLDRWFATRQGPSTVVHGDFRLDNLLFVPGEFQPVVVDFQTAAWGLAAHDVAYFIGGSLEAAERRSAEEDLLDEYMGRLAGLGLVGVSHAAMDASYRLGTLSGLVMAIGASMLVKRTERGDEMFLTSTRRHAQHALDLDALELLRGT